MEDRDAFAEKAGISKSTIANYERGDRTPDAAMLERYHDAWGVDLNWLILGEGTMFPAARGIGTVTEIEGMVQLPEFDVRASAGLGLPVGDEVQLGAVAFDRQFLRDHGARPEMCSIITASGDSMQPAIPDGSMLVVDHSQTEVKNGLIMVINIGDDLLVKRIRRRLDGTIELISDNPLYPPEAVGPAALEQLRVVGRVVYFCRTP